MTPLCGGVDPYDPLFAGPAKKRRALYKKRAYKIEAPPEDNDDSDDAPEQKKPTIAFKNMKLTDA